MTTFQYDDRTDLADGLRMLLPSPVAVDARDRDDPGERLFPEERAHVDSAVDQRVREFTTVRGCARRALAQLGFPPLPIVPGSERAPVWPTGIVGSMTHCHRFRAAAVATEENACSIGIDAEINSPLPEGILHLITNGSEREHLRSSVLGRSAVAQDRLLFSAKESIFKAWFPLARTWLDFTQCKITLQPGVFVGRLLVPGPVVSNGPLKEMHGRWTVCGEHIFTAVTVPATPHDSITTHSRIRGG